MNTRILTITRAKSIVACLMKVSFYVQTSIQPDLTINNIPCRYLGDLKNGETGNFTIDTSATTVFAIIDRLSKDVCNDSIELPAGENAIILTGKNKFNPFVGNPFRFKK